MSDETTVAPEATETEAAPEASTPEVPAAATEAPPAAEAAPAAPAAPAEPERDLTPEELIEALEASFKDFNDGDIVDGEVVKIDRDEVLLDIGYKSEGVIPSKELSIRHDVDPNEVVKVGDQIEALVLQKEDKEGRLILSKKRAQYERAWGRIEEVMTSGETIKGPVIEVVKGGLILDIGLRGFLPASLVDLRRVRDLHPFVGTELEAKIIELDRNRNNVVLSPPRVPGGVAVRGSQDLPAVPAEGRAPQGHRELHRELRRVRRSGRGGRSRPRLRAQLEARRPPQEVVTVGQEVEVEVLDVDLERERVSLSLKATQEDPWKEFERTSTAGSIIDGQVTKLVPFGAFVRVAPGIEGLVHISEISHEHVDSPESVLSVGDEVKAKVIDVDVSRRRVSLSMRQVTAAPPREPEIKAEPEQRREPQPEMVSTIQIPDDILAAVAQADAARATDPEPAVAEAPPAVEETAAAEAVEEAAAEEAVVEAVEEAAVEEAVEEAVTEAVVEEAIEEAQVEEAVAVVVAEEAVDDAIVAEEAGDAETAVEAEAVAEAAVEEAEEAADDEVSLEAILEDLKRREGRND